MWLHSLGLEQYFNQFQASGFTSLALCAEVTLQSLTDMGIDLPGHKRRLYREGNQTTRSCTDYKLSRCCIK